MTDVLDAAPTVVIRGLDITPTAVSVGLDSPAMSPAPAQAAIRRPASSSRLLVVSIAALLLWFLVFELFLSGISERRSQHTLYAQLRQGLASEVTPFGGAIPLETPIMLMSAPAIKLSSAVVVEGTDSSALRLGPGHLADTPLPGQPGTSVLFGRAATFGAPFRSIGNLRSGDKLQLTTAQGPFTYRVLDVRRPGDRYIPSSAPSQLLLVSVEGSGLRADWAPDRLVYVDAVLASKGVPAEFSPPSAVPNDQLAMHVDTSRLTTLVLWLQGLLVAAIGLGWSWARWGRSQTWLVGIPLILAMLWGATETAATLLPNLV